MVRIVVLALATVGITSGFCRPVAAAPFEPAKVGVFGQETARAYTTADGLPADEVLCILTDPSGDGVYAGTAKGLTRFSDGRWARVEEVQEAPVILIATVEMGSAPCLQQDAQKRFEGIERAVFVAAGDALWDARGMRVADLPQSAKRFYCLAGGMGVLLGTDQGLFRLTAEDDVLSFTPWDEVNDALRAQGGLDVYAIHASEGMGNYALTVVAAGGVYQQRLDETRTWSQWLVPSTETQSWAPAGKARAAMWSDGALWVAGRQCAAALVPRDGWRLFRGPDGLPYDDITSIAAGPDGEIWLGTTKGACRYNGPLTADAVGARAAQFWAYRQGRRWLPDDDVRGVCVTQDGTAWFATPKGVGCIARQPMTLAQKADFYEDQIEKFHKRTEYGYVLEVGLDAPGDTSVVHKHDSDNDGLWTSMYGAGECFAYGATKDPAAKARAQQAWKALKFLGDVTQGGSNPAPPGFVARTVVPVDGGWNPNEKDYTPEKDRQKQKGDTYWKVIVPRWPTSEDGKWYWKTDTSSDELDGHYFFYALYYDLVCETEEEKAPVRERVRSLTDHLIEHDFCLVDHDGKPTRWAVFSPKSVNSDPNWFVERGLNSLSMLSYLSVAEHMTGDRKYREAADMLIRDHGYAQNLLVPKLANGPGSGNQSDDEMAFMSYYNLLRYEKNPELQRIYAFSLSEYWRIEEPERNPFFNFVYAACCEGLTFSNPFGTYPLLTSPERWLEDSVFTLKAFPLDRFNWRHTNEHRLDIVPLSDQTPLFGDTAQGLGYRPNGKTLPIDEQYFNHWNCNQWELNTGGDGRGLGTGTVFTLPYYMGLYHGFIAADRP